MPICASPFLPHGLPISTSDCEPLSRCPSCWFSHISACGTLPLHTTRSILRSIFRRQVWSIFVSFSVTDHVWVPYNRTGNTQDYRTSFFISSFWNLSASINPRLLKVFQAIPILFFISFPELFRNDISCPRYVPRTTNIIAGHFQELLLSVVMLVLIGTLNYKEKQPVLTVFEIDC